MTAQTEFAQLFQTQYDDLHRYVRRRADPSAVEDIVEDTFLAAWRRFDELPEDVRPWLFRTARNVMMNADRSRNRHAALAVRIGEHTPEHVPDSADEVDQRIDLVRAWRRLAPADQEVLALHVWEDLSPKDAAVVLGCSRPAYLMRLSRARARLAPLLGPAVSLIPATATAL